MAARRRSLEERNLKTLRELAALPANKQCFDCHQRGPTYINMTIGSFVCTSCSGILRGLTPPHRVKSITMTTFTPEEIDFLKSRGNEYCRYVWLGTYDSRTSNVDSDIKDEHRKRDLMSQKYEKKRWYVDPDIAIKKLQHDHQFQPKPIVQPTAPSRPYARVPEVQPLTHLLGKTPASLVIETYQNQNNEKWPNPVSSASASSVMTTRNSSHSQGGKRSMDLLSEFAADTFVSPSSTQGSTANGNFANFDSAFVNSDKPVSSSNTGMPASVSLDAYPSLSTAAKESGFFNPAPGTNATGTSKPQQQQQQQPQQQNSQQDRYAALADLDIHFHQPTSVTSPTWSVETTTAAAMANPVTASVNYPAAEPVTNNVFTIAPSNPFASSTSQWGALPTPKISNVPTINPFQSANDSSCLPYQPQPPQLSQAFAPLPVVGSSPSEDVIRAQYGANPTSSCIPFPPFNTGDTSNPPNGYRGGAFFMHQNGEFVTSPTGRANWGVPPSTSMPLAFPTAQPAAPGVPPPTTTAEKCPNQFSQYSEWMPNPANPFAVGSGITGAIPKPSSNNPFL